MYTDDDSEWIPPSEAQLKVINARRERTDKISKRMSEYLLKGYKMLATSCNKCQSIELQTKQGNIYCVACEEIDCDETSKDNPVLSRQAEQSQLREAAAPPPAVAYGGVRMDTTAVVSSASKYSRVKLANEIDLSISAVLTQMGRARENMCVSGGFDPALTRNCVATIKECAECIATLENLKKQ